MPSRCERCGRSHLPIAACGSEAALDIFTNAGGEGQDTADGLEDVAVASYVVHRPLGIRPIGPPSSRQRRDDLAEEASRSSDMLGCVVMSAAALVALLDIVLVVVLVVVG